VDDSVLDGEEAQRPVPGVVLIFSGTAPIFRVLPLEEGPLTLGRNLPASEPLPDERISREHLEVRFEKGRWTIRDLGSRNGTYVDGTLVEGSVTLEHPHCVRAGSTVFLLENDITLLDSEVVDCPEMIIGPRLRPVLDSVTYKAKSEENLLIMGESG